MSPMALWTPDRRVMGLLHARESPARGLPNRVPDRDGDRGGSVNGMTEDPSRPFGRLLTAMITPFTPDGGLDVDGAQRLATHLVDERAGKVIKSVHDFVRRRDQRRRAARHPSR